MFFDMGYRTSFVIRHSINQTKHTEVR